MNNIKWEFGEPITSKTVLDDFEIDYSFRMSDSFKEFITENNGAVPDKCYYDVPRKGMVFANVLSFNQEGIETVYMVIDSFMKNGKLTMLPFGTDGFGNLICLKDGEIVFWNHESDEIEHVADSLADFLELLHD